MRRIRWTTEAANEFEAALTYVQQDKPDAARQLANAVVDRIERLATLPGTGRPGEVKGTRELIVSPFVVVYRYTDEIVEILHIWHGALRLAIATGLPLDAFEIIKQRADSAHLSRDIP